MMRENPSGSTYPCGKDLTVFAFLHILNVDSKIFYDLSRGTQTIYVVSGLLCARSVMDLFSFSLFSFVCACLCLVCRFRINFCDLIHLLCFLCVRSVTDISLLFSDFTDLKFECLCITVAPCPLDLYISL